MKWRLKSVAFLVCGVFVLANSSPAGKKDLLESGKHQLEKKITSEVDGVEDSDDDLLARAKKSSTTTFCVEIKPGNDQPAVVVCDPSKNDQVPIPVPTKPPPAPAPQPEIPYYNPPLITDLIPEYPRELQPSFGYESLILVPQQPQIFPSLYQQPMLQPYPQPQVILVRDPSCPSSNPSIVSSFLQSGLSPGRLYSSRSFEYPGEAGNLWRNGYSPEEEALRSVSGANGLGGMWANGYSSPLNVMDSRRGNPQQNQFANVPRTLGQGSGLINGLRGSDDQINRQFLIQCNPSLTPLPQNPYATGSTGKANEQDPKTVNMGPLGSGLHENHMNHGPIHHHGGIPNGHHHQSGLYPYNQQYNTHYRTMQGAGSQDRAAEGSQAKGGPEMSMQPDQSVYDAFGKIISGQQLGGQVQANPQSSFAAGQVNQQGVPMSGEGKALSGPQQQQKIGSEKVSGGGQDSDNRFYSSSFDQGQNGFRNGMQMANGKDQGMQKQMGFSHSQQQRNGFVSGDMSNSKDQGFQKQMGFSQNQEQQKMTANGPLVAGPQEKNSDQRIRDMPTYSQMLMQKMRSAVGQQNLVQPFMVSTSNLDGNKSPQSKV